MPWPAAVVKLKLAANHLAKAHAAQVKEQIRARAAARREKMASRGGLTSCYKMLRSRPAPSFSVLCEGGRIIADEHELDGRMRQTWHHIFHGDQEGTEHEIAARLLQVQGVPLPGARGQDPGPHRCQAPGGGARVAAHGRGS